MIKKHCQTELDARINNLSKEKNIKCRLYYDRKTNFLSLSEMDLCHLVKKCEVKVYKRRLNQEDILSKMIYKANDSIKYAKSIKDVKIYFKLNQFKLYAKFSGEYKPRSWTILTTRT